MDAKLTLVRDYLPDEEVVVVDGQVVVLPSPPPRSVFTTPHSSSSTTKDASSKEGTKICNLIKANKLQNDPNAGVFVTSITAHSITEVLKCAETVAKAYPETAVMLLATTPVERAMFVATITPSSALRQYLLLGDWLEESTKSACVSGVKVGDSHVGGGITIREISYVDASRECDPEKLVDQVRSNSFSFLRRKGLYKDPPEEKEYTFDDIDGGF